MNPNPIDWIDIEHTADQAHLNIAVGALRRVGNLKLHLEYQDGLRWKRLRRPKIGGFAHSIESGIHIYRKQAWPLPNKKAIYCLSYGALDANRVVSEEIIDLTEPKPALTEIQKKLEKIRRLDTRKRGSRTLGWGFVSVPLAITVVKPLSADHMPGDRVLKWIGWEKDVVQNGKVRMLLFHRNSEGDVARVETSDFRTNSSGQMLNDEGNRRILIKANFLEWRQRGRHIALDGSGISFMVSNQREDLEHRTKWIKWAIKTGNRRVVGVVISEMSDSVIYQDLSIEPNFMLRDRENPTILVGQMNLKCRYLPVKYVSKGSVVGILIRTVARQCIRGGACRDMNLLDFLRFFPELREEDIHKYNFDFLGNKGFPTYNNITIVINSIVQYFAENPDKAQALARVKMYALEKELTSAIASEIREELLSTFPGSIPNNVLDEYWRAWHLSRKDAVSLVPKSAAILSVSLYEYLRSEVGFKRAKSVLTQICNFYLGLFEYDHRNRSVTARPGIGKKIRRMIVSAAIRYYLGYHQTVRAVRHYAKPLDACLQAYKKSFEKEVTFLGLLGSDATEFVGMLHTEVLDVGGEPKLLSRLFSDLIIDGDSTERFLYIQDQMAQSARELFALSEDLNAMTHLDAFKRYSLFRDFPDITRYVYEQFGIRLDPYAYPNGFDAKLGPLDAPPSSEREMGRMTFAEMSVHRCGAMYEQRGKAVATFTKWYSCFLTTIFSFGLAPALFGGAATSVVTKMIWGAVSGLGTMAENFIKNSQDLNFALTKAYAGFDSTENAHVKEAHLYFDLIFDLLRAGAGTYTGKTDKTTFIDWTSIGGLYKIFSHQDGKIASAQISKGLKPILRKLGPASHRKIVYAIEKVVAIASTSTAGGILDIALKESKLGSTIDVKTLMERIYVEAVIRNTRDGDTGMLEELNSPLKSLLETLSQANQYR